MPILRFAPVLMVVALVLGVIAPVRAAAVHHDLDVTLDPAAGTLEVSDRLRLPPGAREFRLAPELAVREASVAGRSLPVRRDGDRLRLTVPDGADDVLIRYGGTLPAFAARTDRAAGAEGAFLPGLSGWLPSTGLEPPSWRLSVRVPAPFLAVATGRLVEETRGADFYRAVFEETRSVEEPSLFAGAWTVAERMHGTLRLRVYGHPEHAPVAEEYLDLTARSIDGYAARIGPYPFDGLSIVSVPPPVGLGFPGLTALGRAVLPLPFVRSQSLTHEILHNWWGNGVRVGEGGNWSEGLTNYLADHAAAQARDPAAGRAMRLDWLRDYAALPPERDSRLTEFRVKSHDASQIVGYGKVALLFHMLRDEIGSEAFDGGLRGFWAGHAFQDAGWSDLRKAFEGAAKRDLEGFFAQWLDRRGAPSLTLVGARMEGDSVALTLRQEADPPYALSVPVEVETANGVERHRVRLDGRETTATLRVAARPLAVAVDPGMDLFRRLDPGETATILRDVTLHPGTAMVLAAPEGEARAAAQTLAARLLDGKAGKGVEGPGVPLLLVGTDEGVASALAARGLPPVPASLTGRGSARVWTIRSPERAPVLAVSGADAAALQALLRPLPHYGRQSWLVFDGGKATDRGVWPVGDSPLRRFVESP
ncbi:M1 family metallopeptidase [Azospirillum doebereinerae]|uniref:M1 family peptidase n=1 Tax=Azospirillum doebereinerae TaxID=92933 RepID=A0A433JAJ1_9PROT|nr:M1 family aminopeptidase [Azospirillum doebereinerae]RUQ72891.1 M1 family peptidase [Azospirillum doebereinerae]